MERKWWIHYVLGGAVDQTNRIFKATVLRMLQTPPKLVEKYRDAGWWGNSIVTDCLDRWVNETPNRVAIVSHFYLDDRTEILTYRQVHNLVDRVAIGLLDLGVKSKDRVLVQLPNWWHFSIIYLACIKIGATIVPVTPIMRHREVRHILHRTEARLAIIPAEFRSNNYVEMMTDLVKELSNPPIVVVVGDPVPEMMISFESELLDHSRKSGSNVGDLTDHRPDAISQISCICFTSGTTGEPKGVMHNQATMMFQTRGPANVLGLGSTDTILMPSPLGHYTGFQYGINTPITLGMKTVLMDYWSPSVAIRLIESEQVSWTWASTTFLMDFADSDDLPSHDLKSLRYFVCGGASIPSALVNDIHHRTSCRVVPDWGMTECGGVTFVDPMDAPSKAAQTDGAPMPEMEIKIVDQNTRLAVPAGKEGILLVRGPSQFVGYYQRPDLWEKSHDNEWFDTGDMAQMDEDGYIRIVGRTKDIVIRGGENIPVADVEEVLFEHPKIKEVSIVAIADQRLGERACACVVLKASEHFTLTELQSWVDQSKMAKQYWPEKLEIFEHFPKTPAGKVQKYMLREIVQARAEKYR